MTDETPTKGERTRIQIEDAAIELFMEHGYHATSMRQIAERANLALGGFTTISRARTKFSKPSLLINILIKGFYRLFWKRKGIRWRIFLVTLRASSLKN